MCYLGIRLSLIMNLASQLPLSLSLSLSLLTVRVSHGGARRSLWLLSSYRSQRRRRLSSATDEKVRNAVGASDRRAFDKRRTPIVAKAPDRVARVSDRRRREIRQLSGAEAPYRRCPAGRGNSPGNGSEGQMPPSKKVIEVAP